jgi:hypothetical protein
VPRTNHLVVGLVSFAALVSGWWWLEALLVLGLVAAVAREDSAPPRSGVGLALVLALAATGLLAGGLSVAGWLVTAALAGLALFSGISGVCLGTRAHRRLFGT